MPVHAGRAQTYHRLTTACSMQNMQNARSLSVTETQLEWHMKPCREYLLHSPRGHINKTSSHGVFLWVKIPATIYTSWQQSLFLDSDSVDWTSWSMLMFEGSVICWVSGYFKSAFNFSFYDRHITSSRCYITGPKPQPLFNFFRNQYFLRQSTIRLQTAEASVTCSSRASSRVAGVIFHL